MAEDEMVRQYHQLNGHEFEQTGRQKQTQERKVGVLQSIEWLRLGNDLLVEQK